MELSPEDIRKDKGKILPPDFKIYIFFDNFCDTCRPEKTEIEDLCEACKTELGPGIIQEWTEVRNIIYEHDYPDREDAEKLLTGVDPELEAATLKTVLKFSPSYYRFWNSDELKKTAEQLELEKKNSLERKKTQSKIGKCVPIVPATRRDSQREVSFPVLEKSDDDDNDLAPIDSVGSDSSE